MTAYALVLLMGLAAGVLSGSIGTGSTVILLPVLVVQFGPKQAVPIMAIASLMTNIGKVLSWWREVDWRAFLAYSLAGVPAAALGARTLLVLPARLVDIFLGVFFLAMIPGRRWLARLDWHMRLRHMAASGAIIGFITGIVISTGPLSITAFTAYGLVKGAFLATEAASSFALMISKAATFRELGALPADAALKGLIIGAALMAGTFLGRAIVQRMSVAMFHYLLDGLMVVSGCTMLWAAMQLGD